MSKLLFVSLAFLMASGCSVVSDMKDMHDATSQMAGSTEKLKDGTQHMSDGMDSMGLKTDHMSQTTDDLYSDARQATAQARARHLEVMEKQPSQEAKVAQAAIYYSAFEFQLWKNFGDDDKEKKEALFKCALEEFFFKLADYMNPYDLDTSPASTDERKMNFYALAVALHNLNPNQILTAKKAGFQPISMLDLIEKSLKEQNDDVPYQHVVLWNRAAAEYLLQVRSNFMAAMMLAKISDIAKPGLKGKWHQAGMYLFSWDGNFSALNLSQIREYTIWMREAVREKEFLKELGSDPKTDSSLLKVLRHLNLGMKPFAAVDASLSEKEKAKTLKRNRELSKLIDAIEEFVR